MPAKRPVRRFAGQGGKMRFKYVECISGLPAMVWVT